MVHQACSNKYSRNSSQKGYLNSFCTFQIEHEITWPSSEQKNLSSRFFSWCTGILLFSSSWPKLAIMRPFRHNRSSHNWSSALTQSVAFDLRFILWCTKQSYQESDEVNENWLLEYAIREILYFCLWPSWVLLRFFRLTY